MRRDELLRNVTSFISYYNEDRPKGKPDGISPKAFREQNPDRTWLMVLPQFTQA